MPATWVTNGRGVLPAGGIHTQERTMLWARMPKELWAFAVECFDLVCTHS